jgi:hypothetical protein
LSSGSVTTGEEGGESRWVYDEVDGGPTRLLAASFPRVCLPATKATAAVVDMTLVVASDEWDDEVIGRGRRGLGSTAVEAGSDDKEVKGEGEGDEGEEVENDECC